MLTLLLALALTQPAVIGSVTPTERPQRFVVTFTVTPGASRWQFHRCPLRGQCLLLSQGNGAMAGATLDEANAKMGDAYIVSVWHGATVERVTVGTITSTRYWAVLPVVARGE